MKDILYIIKILLRKINDEIKDEQGCRKRTKDQYIGQSA